MSVLVEDVLLTIRDIQRRVRRAAEPWPLGPWHQNFIESVAQQIANDRALSSNQSKIILKLARQLRHQLVAGGVSAAQLDDMLATPEYRREPYQSHYLPREARYLGDNRIALRCKPEGLLVTQIKSLEVGRLVADVRGRYLERSRSRFDWSHKLWIVSVHRRNLAAVVRLLRDKQFHLDPLLIDYLARCEASADQASTVSFRDGQVLIANVCDHDILAAWMTAIGQGIVL